MKSNVQKGEIEKLTEARLAEILAINGKVRMEYPIVKNPIVKKSA